MHTANPTLDLTPIGMIFQLIKTAEETEGRTLEMEWTLQPRTGGAPVHLHPGASEAWLVLEGRLDVQVNGRWRTLHAGELLTIPPGTPHTFRNPHHGLTRVYNTHAPALRYQAYFEGLARIVQHLSGGRPAPLARNWKTATYLSMHLHRFRPEIVSVRPSPVLVALLSRVGRWSGCGVE
ncbi:MAG TPA: cupin domain-containing protein [Chitinophagaceae bacterium]|jgi:mannose-6-phosphate isomerase-like protein (cupin superfamily)|nr:cupin domain-containing protein [Chitinophagaceae bacterium]